VGRVDLDKFPERKVSSTFLLMVSTLNHKISYDGIDLVKKEAQLYDAAFDELVDLKARPPFFHKLGDIGIGLIEYQN
jgi:hypothetical protein